MKCSELDRLQQLSDSIREELRHAELLSLLTSDTEGSSFSPAERTMRTALFSCEIDLLFHKSKCLNCQAANALDQKDTEGSVSRQAA